MLTYNQLTPEIMDEYKVIVNCTPVRYVYPVPMNTPIFHTNISHPTICFMICYIILTLLRFYVKKGADKGAITKNGLEMLLLQAFGAWDIWNK